MLESTLLYWITGIFLFIALFAIVAYTIGFEKLGLDKFMPLVIVDSQEAWVIDSRIGKDRVLEEGWHRIIPWVDRVVDKVSLKEKSSNPDPQSIITKDNISIQVDMIAMIKVTDPWKAIMDVDDYESAMVSLVQTSVVDIMGTMELKEIQTQLASISTKIMEQIELKSKRWGIKVMQVEFESVEYSDEVKKSMEKVTSAEAEKKAMLSLAEGRKESAKLEAEALLHKIEILQQNMPNMEHEKILEFLKSMDYISSMQNLSSSSNAKFVLYPSGDQQALDKIMRTEYLSQSMEKQS